MPGVEEANAQDVEAVAFAVRTMAAPGQLTVKPLVGLMAGLRLTLPTKLNVLARLTEIVAAVAPVLKLAGVPTLMVKSPT